MSEQWTLHREHVLKDIISELNDTIRTREAELAALHDVIESQQAELNAARELLRQLAALAAEYSETHDCGNPYRAKSLAKKARDATRAGQEES